MRAAVVVLLATTCSDVLAYRPFDSTDAAVADDGEFELELGPVGWLREGSKNLVVAPAVIANIGLRGDLELVLQGQREVLQNPDPGEPRASIVNTGVFIKHMLRNGTLQDQPGPSIATEYGFLLPEVNGQSGTGFSVAGIVSQRWEPMTISFNSAVSLTRSHHGDLFLGTIFEGRYEWPVRPVLEIFAEWESSGPRTASVLVGAIWRVSKDLQIDFGVRGANSSGEPIREIRLGFTWAFPWKS